MTWACAVVFAAVGVVALVMARNGLAAVGLLPFHQRASGRNWQEFTVAERAVALALTRSVGLGFLVTGLALLAASAAVVVGAVVLAAVLAGLAVVFCAGLAVINYQLQSTTGTSAPWKGSLYAAVIILLGLIGLLWLQ